MELLCVTKEKRTKFKVFLLISKLIQKQTDIIAPKLIIAYTTFLNPIKLTAPN